MKRYLVTFLFVSSDMPLLVNAYPLKFEVSPEDVSYPDNTTFFMFVSSKCETPEELISTFSALQIGTNSFCFGSSDNYVVEEDTRYFVGKQVNWIGVEFIFNPKNKTLIPLKFLGDMNYEIIAP